MNKKLITRLQELDLNQEKVGEAIFREHNKQFTEEFSPLLAGTFGLTTDPQIIGKYLSSRYWHKREVFGDMISIQRKGMREAKSQISENEKTLIALASFFYDSCLDSREVKNSHYNNEAIVAIKTTDEAFHNIDNKPIQAIGYKADNNGLLHISGVRPVINCTPYLQELKATLQKGKDGIDYVIEPISDDELLFYNTQK